MPDIKKAWKTTEYSKYESVYLDDGTTIRHCESVYIDEPITFDFAKAKDNNLVFGWANVAVNKDGEIPIDWQGDEIPPEILEKAAYGFVLKYRETGENHVGESVGHMVESCMFTKQKMESMGIPEGTVPEGWWIGFYVPDDEICQKIKDKEYNMFSIQGKAKRLKV